MVHFYSTNPDVNFPTDSVSRIAHRYSGYDFMTDAEREALAECMRAIGKNSNKGINSALSRVTAGEKVSEKDLYSWFVKYAHVLKAAEGFSTLNPDYRWALFHRG